MITDSPPAACAMPPCACKHRRWKRSHAAVRHRFNEHVCACAIDAMLQDNPSFVSAYFARTLLLGLGRRVEIVAFNHPCEIVRIPATSCKRRRRHRLLLLCVCVYLRAMVWKLSSIRLSHAPPRVRHKQPVHNKPLSLVQTHPNKCTNACARLIRFLITGPQVCCCWCVEYNNSRTRRRTREHGERAVSHRVTRTHTQNIYV